MTLLFVLIFNIRILDRTLVRPSVNYVAWDADRILGCLCDEGYEGYDCSQRSCPKGKDPLLSQDDTGETLVLECQASGGYFAIKVLGYDTFPLPYDADPGLVKRVFESIPTVGLVDITMDRDLDSHLPTVCGSNTTHRTYIQFKDYTTASLPPIRLTTNTSRTRQWLDSDVPLYSSYSSLVLRMVTLWTISCPVCTSCNGYIYLSFKNSLSDAINIMESGVRDRLVSAVSSLDDLFNQGWTNVDINITSSAGRFFDISYNSTQC